VESPKTDQATNKNLVTIADQSYDLSVKADVIKLAIALDTMSADQKNAHALMVAGGLPTDTIANIMADGLLSDVRKAVKEHLKPDYMAKWRATGFEMGGQTITVADYESRVTAMIARLNAERESFVTAFPDSKIGEYALTGGASRARGTKTQHD